MCPAAPATRVEYRPLNGVGPNLAGQQHEGARPALGTLSARALPPLSRHNSHTRSVWYPHLRAISTHRWGQTWGSRSLTQRLRRIAFTSLAGALVEGRTHVAREAAGTKKQRDQLRAAMHDQGCTREQITAEMARRFGFRPRQAWRHTHGWTQDEVAAAYNRLLDHDQAPMTGKRISDFEAWPHGGVKPTTTTLAMLATLYCTIPAKLVDLDDRQAFSTQELIALDTHTTTPPPATSKPSHSPHPEINAAHTTALGDHTPSPNPDTSTTMNHPDHTPQDKTAHRLTMYTRAPSHPQRGHLILALLLAITTAIGGAIITRAPAMNSQPTTPTHPFSPSTPSSLPASGPSPSLSPSPPLPSQTTPPLHQPLLPFSPFTPAAPPPHQPPTLFFPPAQIGPAPQPMSATSQTSPTVTRPHPPPSESPTVKADNTSATAITWKNMYYGLCLEEWEENIAHDLGTLRLWGCNRSTNQMWTEKIMTAHPTSIAKNLVSSRSGKCATYRPESVSVWLAPCGKDGQGWVRHWNNLAYIFEAAEIPGLCLSVTSGPLTEGFTGIQLRPCAPPSPITDWRPY